ncbi:autotransporter outer membrane beta-barrel domain-containing protein [Dyella japonica]|uniref:Outer membrane autotransporter protein n=1 Tax=Dyella japonica TaxID=231455 RepID=A0ABV2K147_9GAMM
MAKPYQGRHRGPGSLTALVALRIAPLAQGLLLTGLLPLATPASAQQVVANGTTQTASGVINTGTVASTGGFALYALNGGTINGVSGLSLTTGGASAMATYAAGAGSSIHVINTTILTTGDGSYGLYAPGGTVTATGGSVTTNGASSLGIGAINGPTSGTVTATGVAVVTHGANSGGASAQGGSVVNLKDVSITTTGTTANGMYTVGASSSGIASLLVADHVTVLVTGNGDLTHAAAVVRGGSSMVIQNGSSITATGTGMAGLSASTAGLVNTLTVTDSSVTSALDTGLRTNGAPFNVSLTRSSISGGSSLLNTINGGILNLTADASNLTGVAMTDTATNSVSNVTLKNGSLWNLSGNSTLSSLILDNATLRYQAPAAITLGSASPSISLASGGGAIDTNGFTIVESQTFSGAGGLTKAGAGTLILPTDNAYTGGTTISAGTLQVGNGGTTGSITGNIVNNGTLAFFRNDPSTPILITNAVSGGGDIRLMGTGGQDESAYQVSAAGGTFTGHIYVEQSRLTITSAAAAVGTGMTVENGGQLWLQANATYAEPLFIEGDGWLETLGRLGALRMANGATASGAVTLIDDAQIDPYFKNDTGTISGAISDGGHGFALEKIGAGTLTLTGANSYTGGTLVSTGTLRVNGNQGAATGLTSVASGATLGGSGTIGGSVVIDNGGILAPGNSPGTLTINGDLTLNAGSLINYELGQANVAGGSFNDLASVGGNLVLDGTLNVTVSAGGSFGAGVYRVFGYGGTLTDNGLAIGTIPSPNYFVQTSVANQVNLVNTTGLTLNYWDGAAGPKNDGVINGGNGVWQSSTGNDNWTQITGTPNAPWSTNAFAIFQGAAGTVTVDNSVGAVSASGMQFAANGYVLGGSMLTLVGSQPTIRVGDGTALGAGYTATVSAPLAGSGALLKTDLGRLILSGANTYSGGTTIAAGTLEVAANGALGAGAVTAGVDGTVTTLQVDNGATIGNRVLLNANSRLDNRGTVSRMAAGQLAVEGHGTGIVVTNSGTVAGDTGVLLADGGTVANTGAITGAGLAVSIQGTTGGTISNAGSITGGTGGIALFQGGTIDNALGGRISSSGGTGISLAIDGSVAPVGIAINNAGTIEGAAVGIDQAIILEGAAGASPFSALVSNGASGTISGNQAGIRIGLDTDVTNAGVIAGDTAVVLGSGTLTNAVGAQINGNTLGVQIYGGARVSNAGRITGTVDLDPVGAVPVNAVTLFTGSSIAGDLNIGANASSTLTLDGAGTQLYSDAVTGTTSFVGPLTKTGDSRWIIDRALTPANTTIVGGILQLGNGGTVGSITGDIADSGVLAFNRSDVVTFNGVISGSGAVGQSGTGTTVLTGTNTYLGTTTASAGQLWINGNQSAATGLTQVLSGATLGGVGIIGGDVTIADGGHLAPGNSPGTLIINGNLALHAGSILDYEFGLANTPGGALNDLTVVGGNLVLDGTLNVAVSAGGSFGPGIYRVFDYDGTLTNNTLAVGTIPSTSYFVQTSIPHQVNLVNTEGLVLNYWDGAAGPRNDGVINGGNGPWQASAGNDNWTQITGTPNAPWADGAFAIFTGSAGTVTVDNSLGAVTANGMQFASNGYVITGDALTLIGPQSIARVGDGTSAGAGMTATINAALTGDTLLLKTDLGTLVLGAANDYSGGTVLEGGTLRLGNAAALGPGRLDMVEGTTLDFSGSYTIANNITLSGDPTINTASGLTDTLSGAISDGTGPGTLEKIGAGTLVLTGASSYSGLTLVQAGTLRAGGGNVFSPISDFTVASGATVDLAGFSQSIGALSNAGLVDFGTGTPPGTVLTVHGNYTGVSGALGLNALLGDDNSPSDRMLIDGGIAGGSTVLDIRQSGAGAVTTGNGIELVGVLNGGTTQAGAFHLGSPVIAGPYEYSLQRGGVDGSDPENWFLRDTLAPPPPPTPPSPPSPPAPPTPPPLPHYRQEVSLYAAAPALAMIQGRQMIGTLHERMGDEEQLLGDPLREPPGESNAMWGRVVYREGKTQGDPIGIYGDGPSYKSDMVTVQVGGHLYRALSDSGRLDQVGVYGAYGNADADVDHNLLSLQFKAGSIGLDTYAAGAYWTHYEPNGAYLDVVGQASWYGFDLKGLRLPQIEPDGFGLAGSVEGGYPFKIGHELVLEPQAQIIYQNLSVDSFADPGAHVRYRDLDSLTGRIGVRLATQGNYEVWVRANLWYEFLGTPKTEFSSAAGWVPFHADLPNLMGQLGVGAGLRITSNVYVFGVANYESTFNGNSHSWDAKMGVRIRF